MKKKLLALLLALTMAVSLVSPAWAVEGGLLDSITDLIEGTVSGKEKMLSAREILVSLEEDVEEAIDEATVNLFEKTQLVIQDLDLPGLDFQWQILIPDTETWVDITGQDEMDVGLSYGMVANMLDEDDQAHIRCAITLGSLTVRSPAIAVDVDEEAEPDFNTQEPEPPEILDEGSVEINDGTARPETPVQPAEPEEPAEPAAPAEPAQPETPAEDPAPVEDEDTTVIDQSGLEGTATAYRHRVANISASRSGAWVVAEENNNDNVKKTYNIVINYLFENNVIVSDPYTASLAEGSAFSATVTFPTVQGYLPYVGETQQNSMELNYTSISENVTFNVTYKPTNVKYTVIHYQQNVDNDQYTIESTETKQGLTASQVPEVAKTYEGFYALLYERPAIAADGSTVIEVYYDRYYYLMNFDMDGGYGTEPIYARYGADLGTVTEPTKAGYTFGGWSGTEGGTTAVTLPATMPAESKTYYAIWSNGEASYTIAYWLENANDDGYSYLGSSTGSATPDGEESGSDSAKADLFPENTKNYYSYNGDKTDKDVTVDADGSTVVNVYYNRNEYTLKFYYMRSYSQTPGGGGGRPGQSGGQTTTYYQIPTSTDGSSNQGGTVSSATWTTVNSAVTLESGYTSSTETKDETINNRNTTVTYYYLTLTAKYGANLSAIWPNAPFANNGNYKFVSWGTQYGSGYNSSHDNKNIKGVYSILDSQLVVSGSTEHTLVSYWATAPTMYSYEIYFSLLDGQTADRTYDSVGYKKYNTYTVGSTDAPSGQSNLTFKGVTYVGMDYDANATKTDGTVIRFYYTRNAHTVTFNNNYGDTNVQNTVYGQLLSSLADENGKYDQYATYPSSLEPGAYTFGGWYQDAACTQEANFNTTMPDENLVFYAKWVPNSHTVKFYLTEKSESIYKPEKADTEASFTVPHAGNISEEYVKNHLEKSAMNEAKPNGDYTFVMWYYYENGVKKPFDPSTQIRKDLTLYGEWSSNTLKQYTVQYVLQSDHSVKVADDITGSGLAGTTKTFDAKGGTDLYAAYQEGYFPTVQSQSLLLDIESNSLVITFEYVPMPAVPYTVKYVEKDTGNSLADDKVVSDNRKAVVTETFKPISGYMPDAYQKRLVVTADGENILCFYYSKDEAHAYYKITHYTQNTDGTTWTEYASSQAVGDIDTRYTASPMTIPGFTYQETKYVVNGTEVTDVTAEGAKLTADGLEVNLYYVRNEYPYQVRYLEQGSSNVLHDPKNGTGKYGQVISESAIDIDGYDKVDPTSATLSIRIDEGEGAPNLNIITFYYKEKEVTINYVVVGPTGATNFGSVAPTTETVKVKSVTAQGSTPTAGDGYKFVGWYKDEACTQPVDASWVTDNKIVPQKTDGKNVAATYYAKFVADTTSLTITKTVTGTVDANQTFLFHVTGEGVDMDVVIRGAGSVTISGLKVGSTYTVTEETSWSWRYTPNEGAEKSVTLSATSTENTVTFTNEKKSSKWLNALASAVNTWTSTGIWAEYTPAKGGTES